MKSGAETITFDVKAKLEEKERKSQAFTLGFGLLLTTKPNVLKLEVEGTATLLGKDADIKKMMEIDADTKIPQVLYRIYQHAFTAMYVLSTLLNAPPPPHDLLYSKKQGSAVSGVNVEVEAEKAEAANGLTVQADVGSKETSEVATPGK